MNKVLMLATTAAMIEQFNKNNILVLKEMGLTVDVAGNFEEGNPISDERLDEFKLWIKEQGGAYYHIPANRNPMKLHENVSAYKQVVSLINREHYQFIHVHTPIGSVIGRYAARKTNTPIIYTAHGFHFYQGAPLQNWLLYYPIEKHCSRFTDYLITINQEDYQFAKRKMHADNIRYIPGVGIDLQEFNATSVSEATKLQLRKSLGLTSEDILLLSVGELNANKNHRIVISSMKKLLSGYPNVHYVIAGKGKLKDELIHLAEEEGVSSHVHLLGFCSNVRDWYATADLFVFPSFREGLSVSLMEAMANGLPCVVSKIRGNTDLVDEKLGGIYMKPDDCESVTQALLSVLAVDREKMGTHNLEKIKLFRKESVAEEMKGIYSELWQKNNL